MPRLVSNTLWFLLCTTGLWVIVALVGGLVTKKAVRE